MFASRVVFRLALSARVTFHRESLNCVFQKILSGQNSYQRRSQNYSTAADNTYPPRWIQLEPELDDVLIPRKLSVSPLETWLSLRYSLPALGESPRPLTDAEQLDEKVLPPVYVPVLEDRDDQITPILCKNVLKTRRRKINRHKYKKLRKRMKFVWRKVMYSRMRKKQKRFEEDLQQIVRRSGLKRSLNKLVIPKVFTGERNARSRK